MFSADNVTCPEQRCRQIVQEKVAWDKILLRCDPGSKERKKAHEGAVKEP